MTGVRRATTRKGPFLRQLQPERAALPGHRHEARFATGFF
jgi:hypothetical protein